MKKLTNLRGAKALNMNEQKEIFGGNLIIKLKVVADCTGHPNGTDCYNGGPHCPGVCTTGFNGEQYCLPY